MSRPLNKILIASLLGLLLSLSNVVLADHLHDSPADEAHCEICLSGSTAADIGCDGFNAPPVPATPQLKESPRQLPLEFFRLHQYQRGPPLLR